MEMIDVGELTPYINLSETTVEKCTDGDHVLVDHGIQKAIARGTREELQNYQRGRTVI